MGVSTDSITIFGVRYVYKAKPPVKTKVRGCQHDLPENAKFCPTCGEQAYKTFVQENYDEDDLYEKFYDIISKLQKTNPGFKWQMTQEYEKPNFFLGWGSKLDSYSRNEYEEISLNNIEEGKEFLFRALNEAGIDTSNLKFGLFNIFYQG